MQQVEKWQDTAEAMEDFIFTRWEIVPKGLVLIDDGEGNVAGGEQF